MDRRINYRNLPLIKGHKKALYHFLLVTVLICHFGFPSFAKEKVSPIIGMRIDPSFLYETVFKKEGVNDALCAAKMIVADALSMGVNTLFFYIFNSEYGAFYPTNHRYTAIEQGYGKQDIVGHLIEEAQKNKIQVVGVIPINNFFTPWKEKPQWRLHLSGNYYICPSGSYYLLSAWNEDFKQWFKGFLQDILLRYSSLSGIEVVEAQIDPYGQLTSILHPDHIETFVKKYPKKVKPNESFMQFHSRGLTQLIAMAGKMIHQYKKNFYLSQTWTVDEDGRLVSSQQIRESCGFDFDAVLNLPKKERPDAIVTELIWQQWSDTYRKKHFSPKWTHTAIRQCQNNFKNRTKLIVHIEVTPFGKIIPTEKQFSQSIKIALQENKAGICFYDYHQLKELNWKIKIDRFSAQ